jgi:simple sugar transport system ATP-binding protein
VSAATDTPIVELVGITKSFPGVLANDRIDLTLRTGEVHCLLGENGAGKSTLIGILSGLHRPDAGTIRVDGVDTSISSPRTALELGIGTVPQHSALIPALTVLENLMLGDTRRLRLAETGARKRLSELAQLLGVGVDPDTKAADLSLGHQQQVEIIKAPVARVPCPDPRRADLDADSQGVAELAKVLARLKEQGHAVIFITHKLHEALSLGDFISILRQGRVAGRSIGGRCERRITKHCAQRSCGSCSARRRGRSQTSPSFARSWPRSRRTPRSRRRATSSWSCVR